MSTGERIRFFRKRNKMTQEDLGKTMGFTNTSANIRVAQYEWNRRTPKKDVIEQFAKVFDVAPEALQNPDLDSRIGLMHTLFTIEDLYGLTVAVLDGQVCLKQDLNHPRFNKLLADDLKAWSDMKAHLNAGTVTSEEYDHWRYNYPEKRDVYEKKDRLAYYYHKVQSGPSEVREGTAVYTEDDVIRILQLYKEKYMEKRDEH